MNQRNLVPLIAAFAALKNEDEINRFLHDLCTPAELNAFAERWEIAQLLYQGDKSYRDIAETTKASTTTVARVARFLHQEPHEGYKIILNRNKK